jgi:phosphatidylglycerophosphate synthase
MESIRQLREICQYGRSDKFYSADLLDRYILRRVSIYFTSFFLRVGFTPNKVTLLSLLPGIAAGALVTLPQAKYWLIAWALLLIAKILDCCDGEVARYQRSTSPLGEYNDEIAGGYLFYAFLFACMSFGIYQAIGSSIVFIFGFTLVIGWMLYWFSPILCQTILCRKEMLHHELDRIERVEVPKTLTWLLIPYGRMIFTHTGFFFALLLISISDMFIPLLSVGLFDFNIRFIYLALFAFAVVFGSLLRIYDVNKRGVTLHK